MHNERMLVFVCDFEIYDNMHLVKLLLLLLFSYLFLYDDDDYVSLARSYSSQFFSFVF